MLSDVAKLEWLSSQIKYISCLINTQFDEKYLWVPVSGCKLEQVNKHNVFIAREMSVLEIKYMIYLTQICSYTGQKTVVIFYGLIKVVLND
jgi:hypothetical protein